MPELELTSKDIHMGALVYSSNGENVGKVRFCAAVDKSPYTLHRLIVERTVPELPEVLVLAENIKSVSAQRIDLNIDSQEFAKCEVFVAGDWFGNYQPSSQSNKSHRPYQPRRPGGRPNNNRPNMNRGGMNRNNRGM